MNKPKDEELREKIDKIQRNNFPIAKIEASVEKNFGQATLMTAILNSWLKRATDDLLILIQDSNKELIERIEKALPKRGRSSQELGDVINITINGYNCCLDEVKEILTKIKEEIRLWD